MGIRVLRGRTFGEQDNATAAPVVMVTESVARVSWPGQDPVGQARENRRAAVDSNPWMTVVGVVEDARTSRVEEEPRPTIFRPLAQRSNLNLSLALKTRQTRSR